MRNISFSFDPNFFAHYNSAYNIIVHDVFTGQLCCTVQCPIWIYCVEFSHNGRLLISSGNDECVRLWEARSER